MVHIIIIIILYNQSEQVSSSTRFPFSFVTWTNPSVTILSSSPHLMQLSGSPLQFVLHPKRSQDTQPTASIRDRTLNGVARSNRWRAKKGLLTWWSKGNAIVEAIHLSENEESEDSRHVESSFFHNFAALKSVIVYTRVARYSCISSPVTLIPLPAPTLTPTRGLRVGVIFAWVSRGEDIMPFML